MKRHEFNEVLYNESIGALTERYAECKSSRKGGQSAGQKAGLRKARSKGGGFDQMPRAQQKRIAREGGESPRRRRCENVEEDVVNNSETLDFTLCQRPDGSYYGTAGQCRKGTETTRDDAMAKIKKAAKGLSPEAKKKLEGLSDENLGRVADAVTKRGLTVDEGQQVARGVERLSGEKAGGKKEGGANLQDPGEAKKYADFYEGKKDLTYEPPMNTNPKVVKETLARLKEEDPKAYASTMSALSGKGSPTKEQLEAAGWKSSNERGQAVLKSLMDNDFKDVMGNELSWRQGLQLDHKQAGSTGGTDNPKNWIWISTATNQAKGGLEAAAQKKGLKGQEADTYIRNGLVGKLQKNAKMSAEEVAAAKGAGAAKAQAKAQQARAMKDNLPLMTSQQRAQRINDAGGEELKAMLKGSVADGKNPVTGRNTSYRPVLSGGDGARVRKAYGTTPQMKSLMRLRWGEELSDNDLRNVGGILRASTGSKKTTEDKLDELLGNFPPTTGLTAAQRIEIIRSAESDNFAENEDRLFDFARCQRADGSFYGTSGQCRKGTPVGAREKAALKKAAKSGNKRAAKALAKLARKEEEAKGAAPAKADDAEALRKRFKESKKVLGQGSYGEVKETAEGTVIKKGYIGKQEIEIQKKLADVDGVPKVIGVAYTSKPFADRNGDRMGVVEMEKASGPALMQQQFKLDHNIKGATATKVADQYIKLRKELHTRGVAHGDMHEGNLTWNGKKLGVLDFGLSKTGSKAALQEALGTKGNDIRAAGVLDGLRRDGGKSGKALTQFSKNLIKIEKKLGIYDEYGPNPGAVMAKINKMSDKQAQSLLEELYDGV